MELETMNAETLRKHTICGNGLGEEWQDMSDVWREKVEVLPRELITRAQEFIKSGVVWAHTPSVPALRARGVVWVIGLTQIGKEMLAALRADDGGGEVVGRFLHSKAPNVQVQRQAESLSAGTKG